MWATSRGMLVAVALLAGLVSGGSQPVAANTITVRLQPGHAVGWIGETVPVSVWVDGVSDLGAFEFYLGYDPAVLRATGAELGTFLTSTGRTPVPLGPLVTDDEIRFAGASYGTAAGPDGGGVLARVTFRVVGSGTSALTFNRIIVTDTAAQVLPASTVNGLFTAGELSHAPLYLPLVLKGAPVPRAIMHKKATRTNMQSFTMEAVSCADTRQQSSSSSFSLLYECSSPRGRRPPPRAPSNSR